MHVPEVTSEYVGVVATEWGSSIVSMARGLRLAKGARGRLIHTARRADETVDETVVTAHRC